MTATRGARFGRKAAYRLVYVLVCALASLVLLELMLRLFGPVSLSAISARSIRLSERADLMYELVPSFGDHNAEGFRDDPHTLEKPGGVSRVIALGDSLTYGLSVRRGETYPKQLEILLNSSQRQREGRVQVLNFGVPGYSIIQERALMEHKGMAYQPDLVLLLVCMNDWQPYTVEFGALLELGRGARRELISSYYDPGNSALRRFLFRFQIYRHLRYQLLRRRTPPKTKSGGQAGNSVKRFYADGRFFGEHLARLSRLLERRGTGLVVALLPFAPEHPSFNPEEYGRRSEELRRHCRRLGCRLVLPFGSGGVAHPQRPGGVSDLFTRDHVHLNPAGHRVLARALHPIIEQQLARRR